MNFLKHQERWSLYCECVPTLPFTLNVFPYVPPVPPGPPKDLHHDDVDKTEVWLVWNWPDRNGGSEITGFLVEYQEEGEKEWDEWKTVSIPESHVTGLEEGKTYRFRVRAENAIGLSRPDTTVPILCQEKLGEIQNRTNNLRHLYKMKFMLDQL